MKTLTLIILASALLLDCTAQTVSAAPNHSDYSKRILGRWLGPRKFIIFHANGTWAVQRNEDAPQEINGRRWHINGNKLTLTFPGDHGTQSVVDTIVSFTQNKFVTKDDGIATTYERAPQ